MTTRWQRINAVFDRALELPAGERAAYVDEACAGDAELRSEVMRLLDADARASGFIEAPLQQEFERVARLREKSVEGRLIGAWRVLKEIGRGGMGTVCLGERADRQFAQQVAIKLIHPGMDTEWVQRRFRTERQILASLDHPHIARLYDGGTTDDGVLYFVMEFIEGVPIDRYCDERRLNITKRLDLFRQVCAAVAFAHQNLVIHRDIKPSNVIVAGDGTAKLLDFGIATILQDDEVGGEARGERRTATGQPLMTPEYASPEQIAGLRATTLSDVYSLGVMLYELVCGRSPYRFATRSFAEVARVVGEAKPERPSTALAPSRTAESDPARAGASADEISALREGSVDRLRRRLRGDLDTIVLKAMHSDPQRRYASVEQFSEDIRRHLVGLPVIARPDTLAYRSRKFIRRNRVAVGGGALIAISLFAGVAATTWQAWRAREAQARAEHRFADLRKLAHSVLFDYHDAVKDLAGSTPVRERLVKDGLEYLDGLAREAGDDASLQRELAAAYHRMGEVQGGTMFANLGNTAGALESYQKAEAIYEALMVADSANSENRRGFAVNLVKLAHILWETGATEEAMENTRRAEPILESLVHEAPADIELRRQMIGALDTEGMVLNETGDAAGAVAIHTRQIAHAEAMSLIDRANPLARRTLATAHDHLGAALITLGDYEKALEHNEASLRARADLAAEFPLNADYQRALGVSYYNDGEIRTKLGRDREALESYGRFLAISQTLALADPKNEQYRGDQAYARVRMGDMLVSLADPRGALAHYRAALALWSADVKTDPENLWKRAALLEAHAKMAKTLARDHAGAAAAAHCAEALALMEMTTLEPTNAQFRALFAQTFADLGEVYSFVAAAPATGGAARRERWGNALEMYQRSAAIWLDLRERGLLGKNDSDPLEIVNREIARCSSAIRE